MEIKFEDSAARGRDASEAARRKWVTTQLESLCLRNTTPGPLALAGSTTVDVTWLAR
jgi:hypothetical protein